MNTTDRPELRRHAQALAHDLPSVLMQARRLAAATTGAHGRRQAGPGDAFWQYREHRAEDSARMIDWRRSGRSDRLFVREREREVAQTVQVWLDPDPGFSWRSGPEHPTKSDRAATLLLAAAILLWRSGERVGVLGRPITRRYRHAETTLLTALFTIADRDPPPPSPRAGAILASDGYAPLQVWRSRLDVIAKRSAFGALLLTSDPAEDEFPFAGRTEFRSHDGADRMTFGRAEEVRTAFRERLAAHMTGLTEICDTFGFVVVRHRTDRPPGAALSALIAALERRH